MGEEWTSRWGTATIFINGEKLGVLETESKTITMEYKQFNEGDKVLLNGNTENIYVISKVIHNYRGNGGCRYHLRKENEEYGSNLSFVRGSKLSAYEGEHRNVKIGDWLRCTTTNKVFKLYAVDYSESLRCFVVGDKDAFVTHTFEPYSPKEGEFYCSESAFGHKFITYSDKSKADLYNLNIETGYIEVMWHYYSPTPTNIRPATEEEKQTLIKAVEDEYNKTYCEKTKEWVDVNKGTIEVELVVKPIMDFATEVRNKTEEYANANAERFHQITKDMADLYERKNKDYGNSFSKGIERRGFGSAVDRLYDKVDRLNQLLVENKTAEVKDESVIDTLKDLANYSIMMILEVEKKKVDK